MNSQWIISLFCVLSLVGFALLNHNTVYAQATQAADTKEVQPEHIMPKIPKPAGKQLFEGWYILRVNGKMRGEEGMEGRVIANYQIQLFKTKAGVVTLKIEAKIDDGEMKNSMEGLSIYAPDQQGQLSLKSSWSRSTRNGLFDHMAHLEVKAAHANRKLWYQYSYMNDERLPAPVFWRKAENTLPPKPVVDDLFFVLLPFLFTENKKYPDVKTLSFPHPFEAEEEQELQDEQIQVESGTEREQGFELTRRPGAKPGQSSFDVRNKQFGEEEKMELEFTKEGQLLKIVHSFGSIEKVDKPVKLGVPATQPATQPSE